MATRTAEGGGSLVHQAVQAVRDHIRDNDMKVGDTLPGEGQFAADLGVSRAVMREAFGALAALRLIDVANGRRARVGAIDGSVMGASLDHAVSTSQISVADVWDVRHTVEMRIAALAAERRTDAEARALVELTDRMRDAAEAGDIAAMIAHDIAFHDAMAKATRNDLFRQLLRSFAPLMEVAVPKAWEARQMPEQRETTISRHRALAQAIADGDPQAAQRAMAAHFETSVGEYLKGVGGSRD